VCNKLDSLSVTISQHKAGIVLITESWLNADYPDSFLGFDGNFSVYRKDRTAGIGGGVCALISSRLNSKPVFLKEKFNHLEIIAFDVQFESIKYRIITGYRAPSYDNLAESYAADFICCLQEIVHPDYVTIIAGDFNLPHLDWESYSCPCSSIYSQFAEFFEAGGFYQCVPVATRGQNLLDIVLCNDSMSISHCTTDAPLGSSDHDTVIFQFELPNSAGDGEEVINEIFYDFNHADFVSFNNFIRQQPWYDILTCSDDVDLIWSRFCSVLDEGISLFVPTKIKRTKSKNRLQRYPLYIRKLFKKKKAAWRAKKNFGTPALLLKYKNISKKCDEALHEFLRKKEESLINCNNVGSFYKYINSKTTNKTGVGILKDSSGVDLTSDKSKADALNNFFCSVFTLDNNLIPSLDKLVDGSCVFDDVNFSHEAIESVIRKLQPKYSSGPDGYTPFMVKSLVESIVLPLTLIFSASFTFGKLPTMWKKAIVTPVFKKGLPSDVNNYRPISLTSVFCRIMESVIKTQMLDYLVSNKLITRHQHGFLSRHSTCTQLIECTNEWSLSLNTRQCVDVAYIDFSKAFDSVCHSKLCAKLTSYGIDGKLLKWLSLFLNGRSQRVKVGNCFSDYKPVYSGVPQGSVLGPILFLLYINDIVSLFGNDITVKLFADDVKMYVSFDNINDCRILQTGLDLLCDWCKRWQLNASPTKCMILHFGCKNPLVSYSINNTVLPNVEEVKDLGICVDNCLKFDKHISCIVAKASQRAALILRCFKSRDAILLFRAFAAYVRPILEYCSQVWSPHYSTLINKVECVQRRFTKRLHGFSKLPYLERLKLLSVETLELRRVRADLVMVFRIVNHCVALDARELFLFRTNLSLDRPTRGHNMRFVKPHCNLNCRLNAFNCRVINAWNSLPQAVIDCKTVNAFKNSLNSVDLTSFLILET